ncbi:signal peptidase II [Lichenicoccus roseus]|uniref:Lipoprotein signal peptidase n=1 Tax=Lichenicoccus roseus TaxID=2683649 RepID=A0A5R9J5Q5_9PROT|nr:signal peptidase II [Lichenicoccus roseus]TLU72954.1 signal peptidase II [Lichenicoccus roseus]
MMRLGLLCGGVVLVADQASKYWILNGLDLPALGSIALLPVLNFTMVWNHGVTFGMFNGLGRTGPLLLTLVAVVVVALLLAWMRRARTRLVAGALGAIAGGAIGNVIDRLRFGAVVDFIHAHVFGWSWYVFNVADAAIVCGVGVLLLDSLLDRRAAATDAPVPDRR